MELKAGMSSSTSHHVHCWLQKPWILQSPQPRGPFPLGTSSSLVHECQTKKGRCKNHGVLAHCYFCNSPSPFSFTFNLATSLSSAKEPFIVVPAFTKPLFVTNGHQPHFQGSAPFIPLCCEQVTSNQRHPQVPGR